jgi:flagellar biosynthesis chaperone FliJ
MGSIESNLRNSFKKVRSEIENLQHQISQLKQKVEDIDILLVEKEKKNVSIKKKK